MTKTATNQQVVCLQNWLSVSTSQNQVFPGIWSDDPFVTSKASVTRFKIFHLVQTIIWHSPAGTEGMWYLRFFQKFLFEHTLVSLSVVP